MQKRYRQKKDAVLRQFNEWEKTHPPKKTDLKALKDKLKK